MYKPIISNVRKVLETRDIGNLRPQTYRFIIAHIGFIAHYNLDGFKAEYSDLREFCRRLQTSEYDPADLDYTLKRADRIESLHNGTVVTTNKDVAETIRAIVALVREQETELNRVFADRERETELAQAATLAKKHGYRLESVS